LDLTLIPPSALFDHTPERPPMLVLLAEDDPAQRRILQTLLERNNFIVTACSELAQAKEELQKATFDAVLTDLHLADESGLDLLWEAARVQTETARILVSATVDVESMMAAVNGVGVYQVVEKPIHHTQLLSTLDRACSLTRVVREKDRLQKALADRTRELESLTATLQSTVTRRTTELLCGLLAALDWRDTETQAHSRRVAAYARRLGQQLEVEGETLANITAGALLHDVGKIGVPDNILRKRGPLTPEEWTLIQRHPAMGDTLLRPIPMLQGARQVVMEHHERWDGSGYPRGISGLEIDLGARIFAVVDAHDAITSDRPHRPGRPIAAARELITLASGNQFDPRVVDAYVAIPDHDLQEIAHAYEDTAPWTTLGDLLSGLKVT
jgi:response regulator RpfG family c-di-GMP phosphodiesterase